MLKSMPKQPRSLLLFQKALSIILLACIAILAIAGTISLLMRMFE
jgi:hypothetical protein